MTKHITPGGAWKGEKLEGSRNHSWIMQECAEGPHNGGIGTGSRCTLSSGSCMHTHNPCSRVLWTSGSTRSRRSANCSLATSGAKQGQILTVGSASAAAEAVFCVSLAALMQGSIADTRPPRGASLLGSDCCVEWARLRPWVAGSGRVAQTNQSTRLP